MPKIKNLKHFCQRKIDDFSIFFLPKKTNGYLAAGKNICEVSIPQKAISLTKLAFWSPFSRRFELLGKKPWGQAGLSAGTPTQDQKKHRIRPKRSGYGGL